MHRPWPCARRRWKATTRSRAPARSCSPRNRGRETTHRANCRTMQPSLRRKLEALAERREELERLLSDPDVIGDAERFRDLSREFAQLEPVATALAAGAQARR